MSDPASIRDIEQAMVEIRRSQNRRALSRQLQAAARAPLSDSFVVDALDREPEAPPGVGDVADRMGVDPSRASRMVAGAITRGYVERVAIQEDGRRTGLRLTAPGRELADAAKSVRLAAFGKVVADWPDQDVRTFAQLLARFVDGIRGL